MNFLQGSDARGRWKRVLETLVPLDGPQFMSLKSQGFVGRWFERHCSNELEGLITRPQISYLESRGKAGIWSLL